VVAIPVEGPVVYVIDAGASMRDTFNAAAAVVRHSIVSLGTDGRYNLVRVAEDGPKVLSENWLIAGADGQARAKAALGATLPGGATELAPAVRRAIDLKPETVVVFAAKGPAEPEALARAAKDAGCVVHVVGLGYGLLGADAMEALAERTGGRFVQYGPGEIANWLDEAPPLP
jgi:Mg-chelatase subunit ChlD